MSGNDLADAIKGIPFFTRYWFCGTVILSLISRFGIINGYYLILHYEPILHKFQLWRPLTALLFYPITPQTGFHFLINLYFLYSYSSRLEEGLFASKRADYAFLLLFNWACLVVSLTWSQILIESSCSQLIGLLNEMFLLMDAMVISVMYIWCQYNRDTMVQFWFGTTFKAMYLPWVLAGLNFIIRGNATAEITGIIVGHLNYFFTYQYPQEFGGKQWISTPSFMYSLFPQQTVVSGMGGPSMFGQRPSAPANNAGRNTGGFFSNTRFPGSGRRLGD